MNVVELLCVLAAGGAGTYLLLGQRQHRNLTRQMFSVAFLVGLIAFAAFPGGYEPVPVGTIPYKVKERGYVTSNTCRSCHADEHRSWHKTYHRTMTQVVSPDTVVADFNDVEFEWEGVTYHMLKRDDTFWVDTKQNGEVKISQRVLMSTGSHNYQVYWLESPWHTEPEEFPLYWSIELERWVPRKLTVLEPPGTGDKMGNWSYHCIRCHSTGGVPGFDAEKENLNAEVAEFGIACEACHGPGKEHVEYYQNPWNRYLQRLGSEPQNTLVNPAKLSKLGSTYVCGRCHANYNERDFDRFLQEGFTFLPGDEDYNASFELTDFDNPAPGHEEYVQNLYWKDGTCRTGGDELNAHIKSPCFERGELTCISCHSMHNSDPVDQLADGMRTNKACIQCHTEYEEDISAHTHHAADSSGSLCYNCHMPHTSFALSKSLRSHRIDSPDVALSAKTGRPNACNLCHLDKTLKWSANTLTEWYDSPEVELTDEQEEVAASLLMLLKGDAIQRAIAAWHMGWQPALEASGMAWQSPFLAKLLQDPYAQVRLLSYKSLKKMPGFESFDFDFLTNEENQLEATTEALSQWKPSDLLADKLQSALLIDDKGQVNWARAQQLLDQRDNTPITIPE